MKNPRFSFALALGLAVSAGAIYEAHATHAEACQYLQKEAERAALAPIQQNAASTLGFTPMSQFDKVYAPQCQPEDANSTLFSAGIAGILTAVASYTGFGLLARILLRPNHMRKL